MRRGRGANDLRVAQELLKLCACGHLRRPQTFGSVGVGEAYLMGWRYKCTAQSHSRERARVRKELGYGRRTLSQKKPGELYRQYTAAAHCTRVPFLLSST